MGKRMARYKYHWFKLFAVFMAILFIQGIAFGQAEEEKEDDAEVFTLEELVVTATYRDTAEMDTPIAMAAVSDQMIEDMGIFDLSDLFLAIPSLNITSTGASQTNINIRGVQSITGNISYQQTYGTSAIYFDDTPVTGGQQPARQMGGAMFDLERVEVLNGPQGTLFGEGSMAGTIRYITKKPDLSRWRFKIQSNVNGLEESGDYGYRLDGMVNIPVVQGKLGVRAVGFTTQIPGYMDRPSTQEEDLNEETNRGGRLTIKWRATDRLTVRATAYNIRTKMGSFAFNYQPYDMATTKVVGKEPGSFDDIRQYNLAVMYIFPWADFLSSTSYMERDADYVAEQTLSVVKFFDWMDTMNMNLINDPVGRPDLPIPHPAIVWYGDPDTCPTCWYPDFNRLYDMDNIESWGSTANLDTNRFVQEFRLVSNTDGPLQWVAGLYYRDSSEQIEAYQPYTMMPGKEQYAHYYYDTWHDPSNTHTDTLEEMAAFGEISYYLTDAWQITAGVRYTDMNQDFSYVQKGTSDQRWTPKVSLAWRPTEDMMFFGLVSTGFRPGNYNGNVMYNIKKLETWMAASGDVLSNNNATPPEQVLLSARIADLESKVFFDGDHVVNYELGAKLGMWENRIHLTASAFYFDWKDVILPTGTGPNMFQPGEQNYNLNFGEAHSQGVEASVSGLVLQNLFLRLGGRWLKAEVDVPFGMDDQPAGKKLPNSPEWNWTVSAAYTIPLTAGIDGEIQVDWSGQNKTYSNVANTNELPAYTITNMRATLRESTENQWRLSLFARNLLNDEILLYNGGESIWGYYLSYAKPRSYGLEFSYEF